MNGLLNCRNERERITPRPNLENHQAVPFRVLRIWNVEVRLQLGAAEDLKFGDVVIARKGAIALGTVTNAHKSGMLGKAGELSIRLEYLKTDDQRVRLRGSKGKEGEGAVGATVALTILFGPIGLIKHGHNVEIKQGTPLTAFVDQDYTLPPAK